MFKLTVIIMRTSNLFRKYSSLILSAGFMGLGTYVYYSPAELSTNAGIVMFIVGLLFAFTILWKRKTSEL